MPNISNAPVAEVEMVVPEAQTSVPSLRNNFAWTFVGNVFYTGCQWGMLSVLAKLGSTSIVGQFTLGLAIGAPIFMFTNLQLRTVQATDVRAECEFADYFTLRLLTTLFGLTAIACIVFFLHVTTGVRIVIFLVAIAKSVECMSDAIAGHLQRHERLKRVSISLMIRGFGSVLVFAVLFSYCRNLAYAVMAMILVWFAVLVLYDIPNARQLLRPRDKFLRANSGILRRLALLSLPLGFAGALGSLNANLPRYFVEHYMGLAAQGVYSSLAYCVTATGLIVLALSQSVTTNLAHLFATGELKGFLRLLAKLCGLGLLMPAVGVPAALLWGKSLLVLIYSPEYGDHAKLLALMVGAAGVTTIAAFILCGMSAARMFREQVPVYIATITVCALSASMLVPRFGLAGAAESVLLASMSTALGGILVMQGAIRRLADQHKTAL